MVIIVMAAHFLSVIMLISCMCMRIIRRLLNIPVIFAGSLNQCGTWQKIRWRHEYYEVYHESGYPS